jgi:hypothetical protein
MANDKSEHPGVPEFDSARAFPASDKPRPWRRRLIFRVVLPVLILLLWHVITNKHVDAAAGKPLVLPLKWTSASVDPVPDEFRFVLFPPVGGVPLWDQPGGTAIGRVGRAVTGSHHEPNLDFVPVTDGAVSGVVEQRLLRWHAPPVEADLMIDAMIRDRRARGVADFDLKAELPPGGRGQAVVTKTAHGITTRSHYTLDGLTAIPVQLDLATRPWIAMNDPIGNARFTRFLLLIPAAGLALYLLLRR